MIVTAPRVAGARTRIAGEVCRTEGYTHAFRGLHLSSSGAKLSDVLVSCRRMRTQRSLLATEPGGVFKFGMCLSA